MNCELVVKNIQKELKDYIIKYDIKSLVIGVSGGIDSALCCALARPVCDELDIPLIGRSLPIESNKQDEIERAKLVGESFCHDFLEDQSLIHSYYQLTDDLHDCVEWDSKADKIRRGNIKARLRMIYLYNLAQVKKGIVLSTDNLTEYYLGFWTLCGDVGDYGMIQQLWKTEVYEVARWIVVNEYSCLKDQDKITSLGICVEANPTDGLGVSNSDLDQLGAKSYEEVDLLLKTWLTKDQDSFTWDDWLKYKNRLEDYESFVNFRELYSNHPVIKRYKATHFKRNWPIVINRKDIFNEE